MNAKSLTVGLVAVAALSLRAGTWHVDANSTATLPTGSPEAPFATIQEAVDAAEASGDAELVVKVSPGTYASGENEDSRGAKNRVVITKKLTLESTGSRDDTVVVGALDAGNAHGLGAGSVRGICVDGADAAGTVIRGFAFRNCSASDSSSIGGHGGAVCFTEDSGSVYVKDCSAVDCAACYGGGFRGVVAIRSLLKGCHNDNSGSRGSAMYKCKAYCCLIVSCGSKSSYNEYILQGNGPYVNCTAVGNSGSLLRSSSSQLIYNSISTLASRQEFDSTSCGGANDVYEYDKGTIANGKVVKTNTTDFYKLLVAPLADDYRPVADGAAEGYGDPQWCALDWIPEEDRDLDYFGNPRIVNGRVDAGAIQGTVAVSGGTLKRTESVPTTGESTYSCAWYANGETWPKMVRITPSPGTFCSELKDGSGNVKSVRYADRNGGFWQTTPVSGVWSLTEIAATATLWVDANSTAETPDGSEDAPYKTIQAAVDAAGDGAADYTFISVKPGVYETGSTDAISCPSRVAIVQKNVFVRAVGEGEAVIRGQFASGETAYGEGAVRCVAIDLGETASNYRVAVQGFRLENGSTMTADVESDLGSRAGAVCAAPFSTETALYAQVLDCTVSNCAGRYGLANAVWLQRCVFVDSLDSPDSALRTSYATSCTFRNVFGKNNGLLANGSYAINCTIDATTENGRVSVGSSTGHFYNSIVEGGNVNREIYVFGVYLHDVTKVDDRGEPRGGTWTDANPLVAYSPNGVWRLLNGSEAFGRWTVNEANLSNVVPYLDADFEGVPLQVTADGKVTPGAFQKPHEPSPDVYVDAVNGNDANDGLSPDSAKKTLAAASAMTTAGGRIVLAAGTYAEGRVVQTRSVVAGTSFAVAARAEVPMYATLEGAGADKTTICGGWSEVGEGELVRGVILRSHATLKGVTVADGLCVTNSAGTLTDDHYAAGVLAESPSLVEDCVIAGNRSHRYGGAVGGTFRRCTFRENWAMGGLASAGRIESLENCLVTGNRGSSILADYASIANCTFLYDNKQVAGNRIAGFGSYVAGASICNSALILSPTQDTSVPDLFNCLLPKINSDTWHWVLKGAAVGCILDETKYKETTWNGVPGEDYLGLDCGDNARVPDGQDLAGAQRIQNATVDIGAYEFDWRPMYSAAFSRRGWATVVETAGTVRDDVAGIAVGADGSVKAKVTKSPGRPVSINATVTAGELVVKVNGEERGRLTADVAKLWLGELVVDDVIELAFADQEGSAVVAGLKGEGGFKVIVR